MQPVPTHVVEVLRKAARHPEGIEPLLDGHLESVAALYQVHPSQVEEARRWVTEPVSFGPQAPSRTWREPAAGMKSVDDVIAQARREPDGLDFLKRAPVETAAVIFGVHPFVIDEARVRLSRRVSHPELMAVAISPRPSAPRFIATEA